MKNEPIFAARHPNRTGHCPAKQTHQTGDLMRKVNGFEFLDCPCGVKLKLPPNLNTDRVRCPRCKQILSVRR